MNYVLTDTGFWTGLFEERDEHHHHAATEIYQHIFSSPAQILIPWPSLYETVNTRAVRNNVFLEGIMGIVQHAYLLDDAPYRQDAIGRLSDYPRYSLVDRVIHYMLEDANLFVDYFVTFNTRDFSYVCQCRDIEIIDESWL
jgi:predicted nucleic acid-binding protein